MFQLAPSDSAVRSITSHPSFSQGLVASDSPRHPRDRLPKQGSLLATLRVAQLLLWGSWPLWSPRELGKSYPRRPNG